MIIHLRKRKLLKVVNGSASQLSIDQPLNWEMWEDDNAAAMTYIISSIDKSQTKHIKKCKTVKEQWSVLKRMHAVQGITRLISLKKKLNTYRANPNAIVNDVAAEIRKIADIITEIELTEAFINLSLALKFIDVIDEKQYALAKWQLKQMNKNLIFIAAIEGLKVVEQKIRDESTIKLFIEMVNRAFSNQFRDECFYCHKKGHRKHDCHRWLTTDIGKNWAKNEAKQKEEEKTAVAAQSNSDEFSW